MSISFFAAGPVEAFSFWPFQKQHEIKTPEFKGALHEDAVTKLTLIEAYRLALKKSETIAISSQEINQAQARFYRSFDYFLPSVNFVMEETYRDAPGGSAGSSGITGDATRRSTPQNRFTFTQPLFSGFKEIAALQGAGADKKQQVLAWKRAKELLFVDVMSAYYNVLKTQRDVHAFARTRRFGATRLRELTKKIKVGRYRATDKQTSLADLKLVEADMVQALSALNVAKNLLEYYLGESLGGRVLTDEEIPAEILKMSSTASRTTSRSETPATHFEIEGKSALRSDVASAEQGFIVSEKKVVAAQADLFPTISANGNYYTRRVGFQSGDDWDVTIQMDVPIFEVGKTLGDIKEAVSTRDAQKLRWQELRRQAELDIQNAVEDLRSLRLREMVLWSARSASDKNYTLVSADYGHNLANNLDVLDALRRLENVELRHNEAYFLMKESYWKFKAALGEIITMPGLEESRKNS